MNSESSGNESSSQEYPADPTTLEEARRLLREEREARQMAEHRAARAEAMLAAIPDFLILMDEDKRHVFVNRDPSEPFGYSAAALIGKTWRDLSFMPEEEGQKFEQAFKEVLATNEPVEYDTAAPAPKSEDARHFRLVLRPVYPDGDDRPYVMSQAHDVTHEQQLSTMLQEAQRFLTRVHQALPDLIYVYDFEKGRNIYANHKVTEQLGYTEEELQQVEGNLLETILHPEDFPRYLEYRKRYDSGSDEDIFQFNYRLVHKDGSFLWVHSREVIFERTPDGKPTQVLGIAQNITERREVERELQLANERYEDLVSNIPAMVYRVDRSTHPPSFLYVSPRVREMNGVEPEKALADANTIFDTVHPDDIDDLYEKLRVSTENETPFSWDGRLIVHNKVRWVHLHSVPRRLPDGRIVYDGIEIDITERKQLETALVEQERLKANLEKERDLNELKSRMMERISHEFRTPLAVIQTSADLLNRYRDRLDETQRQRQFHKIRMEIAHIIRMLDSIQFVIRKHETSKFDPDVVACDLVELVRGVVNESRQTVGAHHQIKVSLSTDPLRVYVDSSMFRLLLTQLINNSVKFSAPGSTINVELAWQGGVVVLTVRDEGIGILPSEKSRVFDAFFRGSNLEEISGIGLGLNIARQIVGRLKGTIEIESELNIGTTVTVMLPLTQEGGNIAPPKGTRQR